MGWTPVVLDGQSVETVESQVITTERLGAVSTE
jgi:hypothetical protein